MNTFSTTSYTVNNSTPTQIITVVPNSIGQPTDPILLAIIQNQDPSNNIYIGGNSSVTVASGIKIVAGQSVPDKLIMEFDGDLYAISDNGNAAVVVGLVLQ